MKDLIKYCRYYKGEDEIPLEISKNGDGMFWFYEKLWVEREDLHGDDTRNMIEYIRSGLEDFRKEDDVPITLKKHYFSTGTLTGEVATEQMRTLNILRSGILNTI